MTKIIKETVTTRNDNVYPVAKVQDNVRATGSQTVEYLVYFFFGMLDIILAFRLVLKIAGASISSAFVRFIYGITGIFISPFEGIFRRGVAPGVETASILEPSTLVAIIVYALVAWGIVKLVRIFSGEKQGS